MSTDPRTFNFTEQTPKHSFANTLAKATYWDHDLQREVNYNYRSWDDYAARTGTPTWQMGWDVDDIDLALQRGYSPYGLTQLRDHAQKLGLRIGPNTPAKLAEIAARSPGSLNAPINYGAQGGYGFDTSDIASMWGQGPTDAQGVAYDMTSPEWSDALEKVRDAWYWAQDQNLPNSSGVGTWFQHKENQQRMAIESKYQEELIAQQAAAAEQQARIAEEAAARAARVKGSSPTGVGGAASIKGSRLSITEGKGRKGTKQFARPTEFLNTLGIGGGGTASRSSQVTL